MAIKIRRKVEPEKTENSKKVLEPDEVISPDGKEAQDTSKTDGISAEDIKNVKVPGMEDDFLRTSGTLMEKLIENRRMVGFTVVTILVIAIAVILVSRFNEQSITDKSSELLQNVFVTYNALTKEQAETLEKANMEQMQQLGIAAQADDILRPTYTVPNDEIRYKTIEQYLTNELPKFYGDDISAPGTLMLAGITAYQKKTAEAEVIYKNAAQKAAQIKHDDLLLFANLGNIETLVGQQKYDEAITLLDSVAVKNQGLQAYTAYKKGLIYEIKGDSTQAIAAYDAAINASVDNAELALSRLRILTPDWSERYQAAQQKKSQLQAQPQNPVQPAQGAL